MNVTIGEKYKETTIGKERYRIVKCEACGKIQNAYQNGNAYGILYSCPEPGCREQGKGIILSVSKAEACIFIRNELEQQARFYGFSRKIFEKTFGLIKI